MHKQPMIPLDKFEGTEEERDLVARIVVPTGREKGRLRSSKPEVTKADPRTGKAAYLWRMVAFGVSVKSKHHSMPVLATMDLPTPRPPSPPRMVVDGRLTVDLDDPEWKALCRFCREQEEAMARELDALAVRVERLVPPEERHGTLAWGRGLGQIK